MEYEFKLYYRLKLIYIYTPCHIKSIHKLDYQGNDTISDGCTNRAKPRHCSPYLTRHVICLKISSLTSFACGTLGN